MPLTIRIRATYTLEGPSTIPMSLFDPDQNPANPFEITDTPRILQYERKHLQPIFSLDDIHRLDGLLSTCGKQAFEASKKRVTLRLGKKDPLPYVYRNKNLEVFYDDLHKRPCISCEEWFTVDQMKACQSNSFFSSSFFSISY